MLRSIWKFLSSMRFALILLGILALACTGGSFITQGQTFAWYEAHYSQRAASAIILFGLDDVFHSWWFILITAFLCLNLLLCNVLRLPALIRRFKKAGTLSQSSLSPGNMEGIVNEDDLKKVFDYMAFPRFQTMETEDGNLYRYAQKNRIGMWGAWVCHLGILLLILGFGLGQMTKKEYAVYGVPGQSKQIEDTEYILTIDDFRIDLREDDTVEQYTSALTIRNAKDGTSRSGSVSVNNPASMFGMKFYQNATGWAATVTVLKDGEQIQQEVVCVGDYLSVADKAGLVILFSAFYPDYYQDPERGPMTAGSALNNPGYLYRAYYQDQVIGMNVLTGDDVITIDEYTVIFSDPQSYTLIQIKKDRFTPLALVGGLVVMLGLLLAFYLQPSSMWACKTEDGTWKVTGRSRKGGSLFDERLKEAIEAAGGRLLEKDPV